MACEHQLDAAAYALGALEPAEAEAFAAHTRECATCRAELTWLRRSAEALTQSVPLLAPPPEVRERVMREVRRSTRRPRIVRPALALAACLLVALVAVLSSRDETGRTVVARVSAPGASATVHVSGDRAALRVQNMPRPAAGETYQVWFVRADGRPRPTHALFNVRDDGRATVQIEDSAAGVRRVLVTAEPSGGSTAPTSAPVITARL